ncbi:hypothetical protein OG455_41550 [Kitasatospora sp. NBC_01287]|uniref:hypothetical protein n=1 Tax=Kitasatospora sp. NBC_01287 TaxID=2903573 RepID=UPI00224F732E|nr:hypothetical protein [Kitasatospora sp. NBC_01287]MCX4750970.1 hypothetical protein [Kitasatospora sp. NBC_01287]MCX4751779.1 hypothetical protein [Kitasatospora sp. NBC_01287]MCX4751929.1 hypothetical protein [Kitasatospora sp. NBC_01287]
MTDTAPLTDEQLADISAREAAARPGPWYREDDKQDLNRWVTNEAGTVEINLGYLGNNNQADAEFVAHAREDMPALLAEVRRLRAVEAAARAFADEMGDYCSPHGIAADYAQRLRDRLQQAEGAA